MSEIKVLATVGDVEITDEEVQLFITHLGPQAAMQFNNPEGIKQVANELINQELLYLEAKKMGLDKEEDFLAELEKVKKNVLKQFAINKVMTSIEEVKEDELKEFYEEKKEFYTTPEMVNAKHILVEEEDTIAKVVKELEEGKTFEDLAKEYSTCPSNERGGDLGEFGRGQMVPEFEEAAFKLEVGQVSEPVKTQFGYHLIKLENKIEAGVSEFEEVKEQIKQQILAMKQQEAYLGKTEELKNEFKVETFFE